MTSQVNKASPEHKAKSLLSVLVGKAITANKASATLIHTAAVACMKHAATYGDVGQCDRLVKNIKGSDSAGLRIWFSHYSRIAWDRDNQCKLVDMKSKLFESLAKRVEMTKVEALEAFKIGGPWACAMAEKTPYYDLAINGERMDRPFTFAEDRVFSMVFAAKNNVAKAIAAGTFKGDKELTSKLLNAFEKTLMEMAPAKAKEIRAKVEDAAAIVEEAATTSNVEDKSGGQEKKATNRRIKEVMPINKAA